MALPLNEKKEESKIEPSTSEQKTEAKVDLIPSKEEDAENKEDKFNRRRSGFKNAEFKKFLSHGIDDMVNDEFKNEIPQRAIGYFREQSHMVYIIPKEGEPNNMAIERVAGRHGKKASDVTLL